MIKILTLILKRNDDELYAFLYVDVHELPEHCFSGWACAVEFGAITFYIPNTSVQVKNSKKRPY
ncbi:Uncharacterised protein [Legionella wadsworthii]|uniref:Uncharacterized protein n=1 Tax=Legionella wadsworthii TaxID=28088 RepID=A0A378LQ42_9GAMM|nr:Uncharacterised protein [Legionella wadsworthii]